ncbi:MAG: hypothetical protein R6U59_02410 [Eubacteriales bacterium]
MKLEVKTNCQIYVETGNISVDNAHKRFNKKWTSNETLVPRLQEALSKTADSSKIVAVRRILKELIEDREINMEEEQ